MNFTIVASWKKILPTPMPAQLSPRGFLALTTPSTNRRLREKKCSVFSKLRARSSSLAAATFQLSNKRTL